MRKLSLTAALLLIISGCFLPIDKSRQGAVPLKKGGYCFWYKNEKDEQYCAYDKNFPPQNNLEYQKCSSCLSLSHGQQPMQTS